MKHIKTFLAEHWQMSMAAVAIILLLLQPERLSISAASKRIAEKILEDHKSFEQLVADSLLLNKVFSGNATLADLEQITNKVQRLYCYEHDSLIFWTDNKTVPTFKRGATPQNISVQRLENGWYVVHFKEIDAQHSVLSLTLIQHTFATTGRFLHNNLFPDLKIPSRFIFAGTVPTAKSVHAVRVNSKMLFYISEGGSIASETDNWYALLLWAFILLVIGLYFHRFASAIAARNGLKQGFLVLVALSGALLSGVFLFRNFLSVSAYPLFNPVYCASGQVVFSLGDLFLYCIVAVWWMLFVSRHGSFVYPIAKSKLKRHVHQSLLILLVYASSLLILFVVKTLVIDSVVSLQVFNLLSLNTYSFIGLMCVALTVLAHYIISYRVIKLIYGISLSTLSFLLNCAVFLVVFTIVFWNSEFTESGIATGLWTTAWLLILLTVFEDRFTLNRTRNLVIITALYATLCTYLLENLYEKRERSLRALAAQTLMQERDFLTEKKFEKTIAEIRNDELLKDSIWENVQTRLNTVHFNRFLNRYDVHFFSVAANSLSQSTDNLSYFTRRMNAAVNPADKLKLCPDSSGNFTYLSIIDLSPRHVLAVELIPRIYSPGNLYSELIADNSLANRVNEEGFSYAIYRNNKLVVQRGEYAYSYYWNNEYDFNGENDVFIDVPGWEHNIHEGNNQKRVIVTVKQESFFEPVAAFSYLFTFFFLLAGGAQLTVQTARKIRNGENPFGEVYSSFRTRINYALLAIIFTSFVVIGFITISFFRQQYDQFYSDKLIAKEKSIITTLEFTLKALSGNHLNAAQIISELGKELPKLSLVNAIDINLFDIQGNLVATSQQSLFERGIISRKMNASALLSFQSNSETQFTQNEKIGLLGYRATYAPIKNENQQNIGFIVIPYYERNQKIDDEVNAFLIALMNVYVFLLIAAAALAYFISNSVTKPLAFIAEKLQVVNLGKKNEPIEWNSRDEIGILVRQYNRMIRELENSAEQLARNERESAWREMAKQIAHEIKNPLTPMKLSIQHLQRAIDENNPRVNELAARVTKTLVEQIENLNAIATSFSSFAKMPRGENEPVDLAEMLRGITELFSAEQEANIHFETSLESAMVFADRNQMLSVFNNLVKNGIQSVPEDLIPEIKIFVSEEHGMIKVEVRDNGIGIAEENYTKVFAPNFTTKSSGTGLGLAISLQIIEGIGGAIWFESVVGQGTSFFVVIPKHEH